MQSVNSKKLAALSGFVVMGLSPSFVDWMQSPEQRPKMLLFYGVGLGLIYFGLFTT